MPQAAVRVVEASAEKAKCPVLPLNSELINRLKDPKRARRLAMTISIGYGHRWSFAASGLDAKALRVKTEKISAKHVRACS